MTGITADTRMMADLPLMVRPNAKSMCVIAFGMGSSYRSALWTGYVSMPWSWCHRCRA